MRAIILAAGEGTRLRPYTLDRPKCLVVLAGRTLLDYQINALSDAGIHDITVVTGYLASRIEELGYRTRHNPDYASTNMVATLMCAADLFDGSDDVLVSYGDIVYETRLVKQLCRGRAAISTTVDTSWLRVWQLRMADPLTDAETMNLDAAGNIRELGKKPRSLQDIQGQYIGLIHISAELAAKIPVTYGRLDQHRLYDGRQPRKMYMTSFLQYLIDEGQPIRAALTAGGCLEVDTKRDLDLYNALHEEDRLAEYCRLPRPAPSRVGVVE